MKTETFKYLDGVTTCLGYLAYDKKCAEMLAGLGYVALAADLYGEGKCGATMDESRHMMNNLSKNPGAHRSRANAGLQALKSQPNVDTKRMAAIRFCFGDMTVLELARNGAPLKGVVSFHGLLSTKAPAKKDQVEASVLVCNGANDPLVPPNDIKAFENEMHHAGVDWQVINYGGTVHSFTNPWADGSDMPHILYNKRSAERSWAAMRAFFDKVLGTV